MTTADFLAKVEEIRQERPTYRLGGDGSDGTCDCMGLIIGAIRRSGGKWTGDHGSNWTARNELVYLLPIGEADDLVVGEVVLKALAPTADGYDLPSRYDEDPDKRDYYHIGVVMSVGPLRIVHCTTGGGANGMAEDTRVGQWTHRGWLSKVSREGEPMVETMTATVVAESGMTVNMRTKPGGALVYRVPVGAEVTVTTRQDGWARVAYGRHSGWMMDEYLDFGEAESGPAGPLEQRVAELTRTVAELLERVAKLEGG